MLPWPWRSRVVDGRGAAPGARGNVREGPARVPSRQNHSLFPFWLSLSVAHATLIRTASAVTQIALNRMNRRIDQWERPQNSERDSDYDQRPTG